MHDPLAPAPDPRRSSDVPRLDAGPVPAPAPDTWAERRFRLADRGTTLGTEVRAGAVTFLTMAYVLIVNPQILSATGMPAGDLLVATALTAGLTTILMGVYADLPFALAPGMGLNAYFTYGVVKGMGVPWEAALAASFAAGVLFLVLARAGIRTALVAAIPDSLKAATTTGIGLFLAIIGLRGAGLVVDHPETLVTLGSVRSAPVLLALAGTLVTGILVARRVPGALLAGVGLVTAAAWIGGLTAPPTAVVEMPAVPRTTFAALDFAALADVRLVGVVIAFLFVGLFDTAGTLVGVSRMAGLLRPDGSLPRADRAFTTDALGTMGGAVLGTSPVTAYVESAAGVQEGGRTGLTAIVCGVLLIVALVFAPVFTAVPAFATAPALIVVGAMMMEGARHVDWERFDEALPAFLTIAAMPFTYSIANGITLGIVSYVLVKVGTGQARAVPPLLYGLAAVLVAFFAFQGH